MRRKIKKFSPGKCKRCGSPVINHFCKDETCPYNVWAQFRSMEYIYEQRKYLISPKMI